jgi:hypothetical protein
MAGIGMAGQERGPGPTGEKRPRTAAVSGTRLLRGHVHLTATALAVMGLAMLWACSGEHALHGQRDAVFDLSNRTVLAVLGLLHLGLSGWLLATRGSMSQGLMILWLGVNCIVYRVGMAWMKGATPLPVVQLVAWKLGANAKAVDICWRLFIAYLVVGSLVHLLLERRRLKGLESEAFLRHWKESRGSVRALER